MKDERNQMKLYIGYDGFLLTSQLYEILSCLERMYNALYAAMAHIDVTRIEFQSRMRIKQINTGSSLTIELMEGVGILFKSGPPVIQVASALGVLGLASQVVIMTVKGVAEIRKIWHEGTEAKLAAYAAEKEEELRIQREQKKKLMTIPDEAKKVAVDSASQMITLLEYAPNIDIVKINGVTILTKNRQGPKKSR